MAKNAARNTEKEEEETEGVVSEDALVEALDEDEDEADMPLLDEDGSEKWE